MIYSLSLSLSRSLSFALTFCLPHSPNPVHSLPHFRTSYLSFAPLSFSHIISPLIFSFT